MKTEKKIDLRYWIGLRQASNQINCTAKEMRALIRQNKWKTTRDRVNNRLRVYIQKSDLKQYLQKNLPTVTHPQEFKPTEIEASFLKIKPVMVFIESYRMAIQLQQDRNLKLTKINYALCCGLFTFFVLTLFGGYVTLKHVSFLKHDNVMQSEKVRDLSQQLNLKEENLIKALNETITRDKAIIERDQEIKELNGKLNSLRETKIPTR